MLQLDGRKPVTFRPAITEWQPDVAFEWLGRTGIPGVFDGRHRFDLEARGEGTRLVQSETFSGLLTGPIMRKISRLTESGFDAMNRALKARAEDGRE